MTPYCLLGVGGGGAPEPPVLLLQGRGDASIFVLGTNDQVFSGLNASPAQSGVSSSPGSFGMEGSAGETVGIDPASSWKPSWEPPSP